MFVVDTNVLVYAADQDSPLHTRCRELLEQWRGQASAWFLTWGIVYEFLRVCTHPRVFRAPWTAGHAWSFVEALLASPGLSILAATKRHSRVAAEVMREIPHLSGNLMHDAQTAVLMREHGIRRVITRDTDFHRFPFLEPIDPVG
ncbi:MAG: PIN domain-containing protein [Acidobacteria bacterium]|nr:PIN domain-containing protein [Acidobacteriota bacterium]